MIKRLLLLLFVSVNAVAQELGIVDCTKLPVMVPERLGSVELYHNNEGFHVVHKNEYRQIKPHFMDKELRKINKHQLAGLLAHGYLSLNQMSDNEFSLEANVRGLGGGGVGATVGVWVGWTVTNVVGHGTIFLACRAADIVVPGSGAAAETGLHIAATPVITAAAKAIAIASGVLLGTVTGPA
jgi:hypothetical protein